tara:strand:- start:326 stop:847 length:522 start_codon:yes stop_codon:yes gene_type:complete
MGSNQVNIQKAMKILGVTAEMDWEGIRNIYRKKIQQIHPDRTDGDRSTGETVELNLAFEVLSQATDEGRNPIPIGQTTSDLSQEIAVPIKHIDSFHQIIEDGHEIGDVTYVSEEEGLIQVLLNAGTQYESMLLIAFDFSTEPATALFTMESKDRSKAPDLDAVIERFANLQAL